MGDGGGSRDGLDGRLALGSSPSARNASDVELAQWILSDTLLQTDEELMAEMRKELGFKRRGNRIDAALRKAIRDARRLLDPR